MFFNNFYQWNLNNRLIVSVGRKTDSVHYDSICSTIFSLPAAFYFVFYYYTSWERVSALKKSTVLTGKSSPQKSCLICICNFFKISKCIEFAGTVGDFPLFAKYRNFKNLNLLWDSMGSRVSLFSLVYTLFYVFVKI